ncbi:hypothetical protein Lbir_0789 [Legionella birminghamensis]|uniref:SidC homolog n=2 Tax=Legionella birminghamensis TaxID=28083 RepID=A0A378IBN7_9GAMM|nr:hypothetical protein Lbir_0789 [Legionella birminghamensis]STX32638.1 SidC homolog [Legionella birminghamensis]
MLFFFKGLPVEVTTLILEKLTDPKDRMAFSQIDQYTKQFRDKLTIETLLKKVANGEKDEVIKIIKAHPESLGFYGCITDRAGREFGLTSAFRLALWCLDIELCIMIVNHVKSLAPELRAKYLDLLEKQLDVHLKEGLTYTFQSQIYTSFFYDLNEIINELKKPLQQLDFQKINNLQFAYPVFLVQVYCHHDRPFAKVLETGDFIPTVRAIKYKDGIKYKSWYDEENQKTQCVRLRENAGLSVGDEGTYADLYVLTKEKISFMDVPEKINIDWNALTLIQAKFLEFYNNLPALLSSEAKAADALNAPEKDEDYTENYTRSPCRN